MAAQPQPQVAPTVVNLSAYNTLACASGTVYQLTYPGTAYFQITNLGTGNLYIKGDGTVAAADPASYKLPVNILISPLVTGGKLFVVADAAITVAVMVVPKR